MEPPGSLRPEGPAPQRTGGAGSAAGAGSTPPGAPPPFYTVHAPIAWWTQHKPSAPALDDGVLRLGFGDLAERVAQGAQALRQAPAVAWMPDEASPAAQLLGFLSILAAGRTAAVGDPDWPPAVRERVAQRLAAQPPAAQAGQAATPEGSFYIGFTSGSTGLPKGFVRSHRSWTSSFEACLQAFGPAARTPLLAPGRLSHSLFLFGALLGLWTGAGLHLQPRFSAAAALKTLADGAACSLVAVPSQLLLMLEQARRHGPSAVPLTRLVMISGAPWPRAQTPALQALFPNARIVEFYGASETSFIAWTDSDAALPAAVVGRPFPTVELRIVQADAEGRLHDVPAGAPGLIAVRSPMLFTGYVETGATAPPLLRDQGWLSVRDMGHVDADGRLHLLGRQQRMLVVQGKNLFPEEVELVLASHPAVAEAAVLTLPDAVRGARAVAVLRLVAPVDRAALVRWCRERLEPYKTPRAFHACTAWPRTASGKTDPAALQRQLDELQAGGAVPGWQPLPWRLTTP